MIDRENLIHISMFLTRSQAKKVLKVIEAFEDGGPLVSAESLRKELET